MSVIDVLVVGGGGREHALAWKLCQSPGCGALYGAPGNPGIAALGECFSVPVSDLDGLVGLASERRVGLVVVGPEAPLAAGLADRLIAAGITVFGPSAAAARIESSKAFARDLMARLEVPQPRFARFTRAEEALGYLDRSGSEGITRVVVKASGLAAGKGAIVCDDLETARAAVRDMLEGGAFGEAGAEVLIEERLEGEEASLLVLADGREALPLPPAQDYKRAFDGDRSLHDGRYEILTGGMGAYAPAPVLNDSLLEEAMERIIRPVVRGLAQAGTPFRGCLYAGLMKTAAGLRVIEFNCRFGDPETQAILPLLESDLLELLLAAANGDLAGREIRCRTGKAVTVVMASGGYPGRYETGKPILGLEEAAAIEGVTLFHAGTAVREGRLVTASGRVLNVSAVGATFAEASARAYAAADRIRFEGRHYRTDIAARVAGRGVAQGVFQVAGKTWERRRGRSP